MTPGNLAGGRTGRHRAARTGQGVFALVVVLATLVTGCAFGPPPPDQAGAPPRLPTPTVSPSPSNDPQATVNVLAKNLAVPWGVAYLPDGTALVTERDSHRILKVGPQQGPDGLVVTPVQTIPGVVTGGDGGLLGIAVSPQYRTDSTVFVYYTTAHDNRIARLRLGGTPEPILTGIPAGHGDNGGRLAFGPDGYLYAGTGDAGTPANARAVESLGGKILRMTADGKPAPGNPLPHSLVWASGFRDVEGLAWSPAKRMYATDLGQGGTDEINLIKAGGNYGWPSVSGSAGNPKYVNPIQTLGPEQAGCPGVAVLGNLLVAACLRGTRLYLVQFTATGDILGAPQSALAGTFGRLRTVVVAPDGTLWVTTSNKDGQGEPKPDDDRILRIVLDSSGAAADT